MLNASTKEVNVHSDKNQERFLGLIIQTRVHYNTKTMLVYFLYVRGSQNFSTESSSDRDSISGDLENLL